MPLTHVSMWTQHGWKRVTIEEAAKEYPRQTRSAKLGDFRCDLCGQNITLSYGPIQGSQFRHSSNEDEKNCEERTFSLYKGVPYEAQFHELPLRIILTTNAFTFQLGFTPLPPQIYTKYQRNQIRIKALEKVERVLIYDMERIDNSTTSYLDVGDYPAEKYSVSIINANAGDYKNYWNESVEGIPKSGILFDAGNGKKIISHSDICVNRPYYLLISTQIRKFPFGILGRLIRYSRVSGNLTWYLYEIIPEALIREAARFFYDLNQYNLTDEPASIQMVWPVFQEDPYLLRHNSEYLFFYLNSDAKPKLFPSGNITTYTCKDGQIISVQNSNRQQLLAIGKTKTLDYINIRHEILDSLIESPNVLVEDINGESVLAGMYERLPKQQILYIDSPVDGFVQLSHDGIIFKKIPLKAEKKLSIDQIRYGDSISIFAGLDLLLQIQYIKNKGKYQNNDVQLADTLNRCRSEKIPIDHSIGALAIKMQKYPKTKLWLYKTIKSGMIDKEALLLLISQFGRARKE